MTDESFKMTRAQFQAQFDTGVILPDDPLLATFGELLDRTFMVHSDVPVALKLVKVDPQVRYRVLKGQPVPADLVHQGVHLVFEGPPADHLPEGQYLVQHGEVVVDLHVMPVHSPVGMQLYQAFHDE